MLVSFDISSDHGGCHIAGGKGAPLRGTKGTLFEGEFGILICVEYL
jgi:arylsulfatase A-like enzyme